MEFASYPSLKGKHVVVTGGGSGIGAAFVEAFARQGSQVSFLDIAADESRALEHKLAECSRPSRYFHCDLREVEAISQTFAQLIERLGPVDVLVNNAANDDRHVLGAVTAEYWNERVAVNLRHVFFCTQAVVDGMKAAGRGVILNLGSVSWHLALADLTIYQTAKAGIEGLTRALARDLGVHGIRVACIVPGGVNTPRQARLWHTPKVEEQIIEQQCLKLRVQPHDVAAMALFLASDDARVCTGHEYFVDAGWC
jgi:NAD(P)-dependent dehydrogenase (short-subunit alcohol dehydrogenase family)